MFHKYVSRPRHVEAVYWDGTDVVLDALQAKGCRWRKERLGVMEASRFGDCRSAVGATAPLEHLQILAGVEGAQGYVDVPQGSYILYSDTPMPHFWPCDKLMFEYKYQPEGAEHAEVE